MNSDTANKGNSVETISAQAIEEIYDLCLEAETDEGKIILRRVFGSDSFANKLDIIKSYVMMLQMGNGFAGKTGFQKLVREKKSLKRENDQLKEENQNLNAEVARLTAILARDEFPPY